MARPISIISNGGRPITNAYPNGAPMTPVDADTPGGEPVTLTVTPGAVPVALVNDDLTEWVSSPPWLPAGAIAYLDFQNGNYYAGGAERAVSDILGGGFDITEISGSGMFVDFTTSTNRPDAIGVLLSDFDTTIDGGLTFVCECDAGAFAPLGTMLMILEGSNANTSEYYIVNEAASLGRGQIYDSAVLNETGPSSELSTGVNKVAFCIFRDEGGGNFGVSASINGNTAFGNADIGLSGASRIVDTVHLFHVDEWSVAMDPIHIRNFTIFGPKSDAELEALST